MKKVELRMNEQNKYEIIKKLVETDENKKRAATKLGCTVRTINNLSLNTRNRERRDSCTETVEDCLLLQFLWT